MYEDLLRNIGLTENEIKTYLALLKIGISTSSKIIGAANISGGKVYETLDKLYKKGLVSISQINGVKHFETTNPNALIALIEEQKNSLEKKETQIQKIIPELLAFRLVNKDPFESNVLTGTRSIKPLITDLFQKAEKTVLVMGIRGDKKFKYNNFWWHITKDLIKSKNANYLFSENTSDYYKKHLNLDSLEVRYLKSITPVAIDIIDDHVLLLTYEENDLKCVHIHSKAIVQSFRSFFFSLWNQAHLPT